MTEGKAHPSKRHHRPSMDRLRWDRPVSALGQPAGPFLSVERQRQRTVVCGCGWSGELWQLLTLRTPALIEGWQDDFPVCPDCRGARGELSYA